MRDAVSARLDGEPPGVASSDLDRHLLSCPECAEWAAQATRVSRLARLDATAVPDLSAAIAARVVLPARRVRRRRLLLRAALLVTALVQLAVGLPAAAGDSLGMSMSAHGAHEGAAWNLAIGVAFVAAAWLPRRASGLVPLLATFVVVLGALSVHDVVDGTVTIARLGTHGAVLVGLVLLIALDRAERALPPGHAPRAESRDDDDGPTTLRTVA